MAVVYIVLAVVLVAAAVVTGSRALDSARKSQCPSCKRWWAIKRVRIEGLDEKHQLATEVCRYCQFTRRRVERIPEEPPAA